MATYREIEERINARKMVIEEIQEKIDSDMADLLDYDQMSEWIVEVMKNEQTQFHVWDVEFWTIEYFVRDLVDKKIEKTVLEGMEHQFASCVRLYELIPKRYARQAVRDMRLRGGNGADGETDRVGTGLPP